MTKSTVNCTYLVMTIASLFIIFSCFMSTVYAEKKHVTVNGRASISNHLTYDQAKQQALNMARSLAVEKAAGVAINSSVLIQNSLIVSELVNTVSHGFLIEEEVLSWRGEWIQSHNKKTLGIPVVEVSLRAVVSIPDKSFYRDFVLDAKLDKKSYQAGDSISMELSASEDIYVLVINYTADNKIMAVYPNEIRNENILSKNTKVILPGKYAKEFNITVHNIPGHKIDTEAFIVFGFPVDRNTANINWLQRFPVGKQIDYSHFFKKILQLPISWIAQKTLIYTVLEN